MSWAEAESRLRLRLHTRGWVENLGIRMDLRSPLPYRTVGEDLALAIAVDLPAALRHVHAHQLAAWQVDLDTAFRMAQANLARISDEDFEEVTPGVFRSPWRDNYDAARIALAWAIERVPVSGERLIAVPHRDCLLVAGLADMAGCRRLIELAESEFDHPRRITPQIYHLRGESVVPLRLAQEHPLYAEVKRLAVLAAMEEYTEQKQALDACHERTGVDIPVALD